MQAETTRLKNRSRKFALLGLAPDAWLRTRGARGRPVLHLTFDDGPHPEFTPPLLELLAASDVRATFFLVGKEAERHPSVVRDIVAAGHALGNHSWSHPRFERLSLRLQLEEIERTDALLASFDGAGRHDFRPPRGVLPPGLVIDCIRKGRRLAMWSYDSLDYTRRPVGELLDVARRQPARAGDIVLMHDDSMIAVEMLRAQIPAWRQRGLELDALPTNGALRAA